ncbi:chorismate mutase [Helicovermis profundi]|uniref:Chorismate mutase domain-containing protein n=1 Tax=Helicovermis profundi TaxID=3065157 RepID=A0AAU9EPK2_9FIRM|nr:hypothetical protein HLPR_24050 [Clostridia bacterium S502]
MEKIDILREEIDKCDKQIVELIEKRLDLALEIAHSKKDNEISLYDEKREKEIINNTCIFLKDLNKKNYIKELFKSILSISKEYQKNM